MQRAESQGTVKCSPVVALLVDTEAKTVAVRRRKLCVLR